MNREKSRPSPVCDMIKLPLEYATKTKIEKLDPQLNLYN